jgi:hypothetical protein
MAASGRGYAAGQYLVVAVGSGGGNDGCEYQVAGRRPVRRQRAKSGGGEEKETTFFLEATCVWAFGCGKKRAQPNSQQLFFVRERA